LHLAYFLDLAEQADREIRGPNQLGWLSHLDSDRDNLRAALDWAIETGQTEMALQLARKLHWFWSVRGDHSEGRQWLQRAVEMLDVSLYPEAYAEALTQIAHHTWLQFGAEEARSFAEQAISIARTHTDKHNTARGLAILGLVLGRHEKDFLAAQAALEESKALYQQVHDEWGYAHAVMCLAWVSYERDDYVTMYSVEEEALARFRKLGDRFFECVVLRGMGVSQMMQGDLVRAKVSFRDALILAQQLESKHEAAQTLWRFAEAAQREGRITHAVSLYWATKCLFDSIGAWQQEDEEKLENDLATPRTALDVAAFAEAVEKGRAMTMEQAIAYALEESN
jgi:tetratricopeptide (TPR) repeat protein